MDRNDFRLRLGGNCIINVMYNQRRGPWASKNLRVVVGSQAFYGHWEFGGPAFKTIKDFRGRTAALLGSAGIFDAHAWLEDDGGRVYDFVASRAMNASMQWRNKPLGIQGWVDGVDKSTLCAVGIEYLAAPDALQREILRAVKLEWPMWAAVLHAGLHVTDETWAALAASAVSTAAAAGTPSVAERARLDVWALTAATAVPPAVTECGAKLWGHWMRLHALVHDDAPTLCAYPVSDPDLFALARNKPSRCAVCSGSVTAMSRCPCLGAWYCGRRCQAVHWPAHKAGCVEDRAAEL